MTKQELQSKIATLQKGINSGKIEGAMLSKMKEQLEKLQGQLAAMEDIKEEKPKAKTKAKVKKEQPKTDTASKLMEIDGEIWDKHKWSSVEDVDNKKYVSSIKSEIRINKIKTPLSQSVYDKLEEENFHSLNKALTELGYYGKKETKEEAKKPAKKYTPFIINGAEKMQKVIQGHYDLAKINDNLYELIKTSDNKPHYEIEKKNDGKWHVNCKVVDKNKTFNSLQGAVNYIAKNIYQGELKEYIDAEKKKAKADKERRESREKQNLPPLKTPTETAGDLKDKVLDKLENKIEDGKDISKDIKGVFNKTKELIHSLKQYKSEIDKGQIKDLIKELESLL